MRLGRSSKNRGRACARRWMPLVGSLCALALVVGCASASTNPLAATPTVSSHAQATPFTVYRGHTSTVYAVVWSPDGTRTASAGNDNTIQVWNAATGHRLVTYTGHLGAVFGLAWSPDGTRIVSASGNTSYEKPMETVQVWNAVTGQALISCPVGSSSGQTHCGRGC
jgi:WD40 repeat protein